MTLRGPRAMERVPPLGLSIEEVSSATGELVERLQQLRALKLIGSDDNRFGPQDIERVHLIQFLERRQIPLETIARGERDEEVLTSVVDFLYPRGVGRRYSVAEAAGIVGLDSDLVRRLHEAAAPSDELMDEHGLRMLAEAKIALDAGFPEAALLQLVRVYADAMGRVAEAEVRLFHFYVHEGLKATGLAGRPGDSTGITPALSVRADRHGPWRARQGPRRGACEEAARLLARSGPGRATGRVTGRVP
jgi:adenylate cyclase